MPRKEKEEAEPTSITLDLSDRRANENIRFGIGWDARKGRDHTTLGADLDLCCMIFDAQGALREIVDGKTSKSRDGAVEHSGDSQTGAGAGDDEWMDVALGKVAPDVSVLIFSMTSYTGISISAFQNVSAHLTDVTSSREPRELLSFNVDESEHNASRTAVVMCKMTREKLRRSPEKSVWKVEAMGRSHTAGSHSDLVRIMEEHLNRSDIKVLTLNKGDTVFFDGPEKLVVGVSWSTKDGSSTPFFLHCLLFDKKGRPLETIGKGEAQASGDGAVTVLKSLASTAKGRSSINNKDTSDDNERISINLTKLSRSTHSLVFVLSTFAEAGAGGTMANFDFGMVHIVNATRKEEAEIARFEIEEDSLATGFLLCALSRDSGDKWSVRAAGIESHDTTLADVSKTASLLLTSTTPKTLSIRKGDALSFEGPRKIQLEVTWSSAVAKPTVGSFCLALDASGQLLEGLDRSKKGDHAVGGLTFLAISNDCEAYEAALLDIPSQVYCLLFGIAAYDSSLGRKGNLVNRATVRLANATTRPPRDICTYGTPVMGDDQLLALCLLFRGAEAGKWVLKALSVTVLANSHLTALPYLRHTLEEAIPRSLAISPGDVVSFKGPVRTCVQVQWHCPTVPLPVAGLEVQVMDGGGHVIESLPLGTKRNESGSIVMATATASNANMGVMNVMLTLDRLPPNMAVAVIVLGGSVRGLDSVTTALVDQDGQTDREVAEFTLPLDVSSETVPSAIVLATLIRGADAGKWKFQAVGAAVTGDLKTGLDTAFDAAAETHAAHITDTIDVRKGDVLAFDGPEAVVVGVAWTAILGKEVTLFGRAVAVDSAGAVIEEIWSENRNGADEIGHIEYCDKATQFPTSPDAEQFYLKLGTLSSDVACVVVMVTALDAAGMFTKVSTVRARLADASGPVERDICTFTHLGTGPHTACLLFMIYRDEAAAAVANKWKVKTIGSNVSGDSAQSVVEAWGRKQQTAAAPRRILLNRGDELSFDGPGEVYLGAGWDVQPSSRVTVSASLYLTNEADKLVDSVVSSSVPQARSSEVRFVRFAANSQGGRTGDNEGFHITLSKVAANVANMYLVLSVVRGEATMEEVLSAYARLINASTSPKREIAMFDVEAQGKHAHLIQLRLFREASQPTLWRMQALGNRVAAGSDILDSVVRDTKEAALATRALDLLTGDVLLFDGSHKALVSVKWAASPGTDLSLSCLVFNPEDKLLTHVDERQPVDADSGLTHSAASASGGAGGGVLARGVTAAAFSGEREEAVGVNLAAVSPRVKIFAFVLTSNSGTFGGLTRILVTLNDATLSGGPLLRELAHYDTPGTLPSSTSAVILSLLYRDVDSAKWKFKALREVSSGATDVKSLVPFIQRKISEHTPKTLALSKGDVVSFAGCRKLVVGFGWDTSNVFVRSSITAVALCFDDNATLLEPIVSRESPRWGGAAIVHSLREGKADKRTPDAESMAVEFGSLPENVFHVFFILSSPSATEFSSVEHAYVRLSDGSTAVPREVCKFDLVKSVASGVGGSGREAAPVQGALLLAQLYREPERMDKWRLRAIGAPVAANTIESMGAVIETFLGKETKGCCTLM